MNEPKPPIQPKKEKDIKRVDEINISDMPDHESLFIYHGSELHKFTRNDENIEHDWRGGKYIVEFTNPLIKQGDRFSISMQDINGETPNKHTLDIPEIDKIEIDF